MEQRRVDDRRGFPRARLARPVDGEIEGLVFEAIGEELSESGMRLHLPWKLPLAGRVCLWLALPRWDGSLSGCRLEGTVVRRASHSIGVSFDQVDRRHRLRVRDYVWRATHEPRV